MRTVTCILLLLCVNYTTQFSIGTPIAISQLLWGKIDFTTILGLGEETQNFIVNTVFASNLTIGQMTQKFQEYIDKMPEEKYVEKPRAQAILDCFKYIKSILKQKSSTLLSVFKKVNSMANVDNNSIQDFQDKVWWIMDTVDADPALRMFMTQFGPNTLTPLIIYIFQDINYSHLKSVIIEGQSFNPELLKRPSSMNDTKSIQELSNNVVSNMKSMEKNPKQ